MLKTMLSTGSKVASSSMVGAAPAIKYHRPRWGSGLWRDNEGSKRIRFWAHHKIHQHPHLSAKQDWRARGSGGLRCLHLGAISAFRTPSSSSPPFPACFLAILSHPRLSASTT